MWPRRSRPLSAPRVTVWWRGQQGYLSSFTEGKTTLSPTDVPGDYGAFVEYEPVLGRYLLLAGAARFAIEGPRVNPRVAFGLSVAEMAPLTARRGRAGLLTRNCSVADLRAHTLGKEDL